MSLRVQRGWTDRENGRALVKLTCSHFVDAEEFDRIRKIAKKQDYCSTNAEIGQYIITQGFDVFTNRFYSTGEEYDEDGNQIQEDEG